MNKTQLNNGLEGAELTYIKDLIDYACLREGITKEAFAERILTDDGRWSKGKLEHKLNGDTPCYDADKKAIMRVISRMRKRNLILTQWFQDSTGLDGAVVQFIAQITIVLILISLLWPI